MKMDVLSPFAQAGDAYAQYQPITTAFVLVERQGCFLLVYNTYRKLWELPGCMVEQAESPEECAVRECLEESNQPLDSVEFLGLLQFSQGIVQKGRVEYSAFFYGQVAKPQDFIKNDEISDMRWWDGRTFIQNICSTSRDMTLWYLAQPKLR